MSDIYLLASVQRQRRTKNEIRAGIAKQIDRRGRDGGHL